MYAGTGFLRQNHLRALLRKQGVKSATEAGWVALRRDMKGQRAILHSGPIHLAMAGEGC